MQIPVEKGSSECDSLSKPKQFLVSAHLNFMEHYIGDTHLQGTGVLNLVLLLRNFTCSF